MYDFRSVYQVWGLLRSPNYANQQADTGHEIGRLGQHHHLKQLLQLFGGQLIGHIDLGVERRP